MSFMTRHLPEKLSHEGRAVLAGRRLTIGARRNWPANFFRIGAANGNLGRGNLRPAGLPGAAFLPPYCLRRARAWSAVTGPIVAVSVWLAIYFRSSRLTRGPDWSPSFFAAASIAWS